MTMFKSMPTFLNLFTSLSLSFIQIVVAISFAGFLFAGPLASYAMLAIYPILIGTTVCQLITALFSSLPIAISPPQDEPLPVYAVMVTAIISGISITSDLFPTTLVAIALSTLATGISFFLLGSFKLGNLIRFIPFPVIVGYLSSIGWLLIIGSLKKCMDQEIPIDHFTALFSMPSMLSWLPVLGFAILMLWAVGRFRNPYTLPGLLILGVLMFYGVVFFADIPMSTLREHGFLFNGLHPETSLDYFKKIVFANIDWRVIGDQTSKILLIVLLCAFSLLLLATSVERATNTDMDFNKELRVAGIGNVVSGLCGGLCCYISAVDTLFNKQMGSINRITGILTALLNLLFFIVGMSAIDYIPRNVLFSLMVFFGLTLVKRWLYEGRSKLSVADFIIVLSILLVVAFAGLLHGVLVGMVIAIGLFVINYSRISTVKYALTGKNLRSSKRRDRVSNSILTKYGDEMLYIKLQGYIFFGTSYALVDYIINLVEQAKRPIKYIVIDFERVFALDSSASSSFDKIKRHALKNNFRVILTEFNPDIKRTLERTGIMNDQYKTIEISSSYDRALEQCEKKIIKQYLPKTTAHEEYKTYFAYDESTWKKFANYFDKFTLSKGEFLFHQGELLSDLYYILSGSASMLLELETGRSRRLATLSAGTTFGNISMYLEIPRPAAVKAEEDCVIFKLTREQLEKMQLENPELAMDFHRANARDLSELLLNAYRQLEILFH